MAVHHCPSWPCPICYPGLPSPPHYPPNYPHYGWGTVAAPKGCICPPGSEKTCQGFACPRKGLSVTFSASGGHDAEERHGAKHESPTAESGDAPKVSGSTIRDGE